MNRVNYISATVEAAMLMEAFTEQFIFTKLTILITKITAENLKQSHY
jgi:hypothetical protein